MPVPTWRTGDGPGRTAQRPAEIKVSNGRLLLRMIPQEGQFTQRIESAATGVVLLDAGGRDLAFCQGRQTLSLAYDRVRLVDAGKANARLRATVDRPEFEITSVFELFDDGSLDVTTALAPRTEMALSSLEQAYQFAPATQGEAPAWDYLWLPNLKENRSQLIGQHVYRSPCLIIQRGSAMCSLLPALGLISPQMPLPATLDFRRPAELRCGLAAQRAVGHVFYAREEGWAAALVPGQAVRFGFRLIAGDDQPERQGMRPAARALWNGYGRNYAGRIQPQRLYWDDLARYAYDSFFERYRVWRGFSLGETPVGGISMRIQRPALSAGGSPLPADYTRRVTAQYLLSPALPLSVKLPFLLDAMRQRSRGLYNSVWFNNMRTAVGMAHFGRRWGDARLTDAAERIKNLALAAPSKAGLFPVGYIGSDRRPAWLAGSRAYFLSTDYGTADLAETGLWMLTYHRTIGQDADLLERCRALGDAFVSAQAEDGSVPAWLNVSAEGRVVAAGPLRAGATSAAAGRFLARLGEMVGEERYVEAARRSADFIIEAVWPKQEWFDFETFYSCSTRSPAWRDAETGLPPQSTLALSWAADLLGQVYRSRREERYLTVGLAVLDVLLLFQQVWDAPFLSYPSFGGFGVTNTDGEWSDARQALFAPLLCDYYDLTGEDEYMQRAIAALRASFTLMFTPEQVGDAETLAELDYGALPENYGHAGADRKNAGYIHPDWGAGSACTAAALLQARYGDLFIDFGRRQAFGINGCQVREVHFSDRAVDLHVDRLISLKAPPHRTLLQRRSVETMWIKCAGAPAGRRLAVWINHNDVGAHSAEELAAGVAYHPSMFSDE